MWEKERAAYAAGKRIQFSSPDYPSWTDTRFPNFFTSGTVHYRIHPDDDKPEWKYILWSPQGTTPPKVVKNSLTEALSSAVVMAQSNMGQEFYVMKAVAVTCAKQGPVVVNTEVFE